MAKKLFKYRGKTLEELQQMSLNELMLIFPSRARRSLKRSNINTQQKSFLEKLRTGKDNIKTHARNIIILPKMVDKTIQIYTGKEFQAVKIQPEMIGHFLGEYALSKKRVQHSSPGVGATKSSSALSVR